MQDAGENTQANAYVNEGNIT